METVGSFHAKTHLAQLLDRVAQGAEFTITKHGKPVAKLVPASSSQRTPDVRKVIEKFKAYSKRRGRTLRGLSVRAMIEEGRP
jgi:prevent-host-death family protein